MKEKKSIFFYSVKFNIPIQKKDPQWEKKWFLMSTAW